MSGTKGIFPRERETKKTLNFRSRSPVWIITFTPPMTKRLLPSLLAVTILATTGCLFHRKARKPKDSPAVATEVEKEFRQRWIAKRVSDLNAQGVNGAAAEQQAEHEFREKYPFAVPKK